MRLVVLGSGGCEPSPLRGGPAYAVRACGRWRLLDLGPGALRAALQAGIDLREVEDFFFSHLHPDHTADLIPLLFAWNHAPGWRPRRSPRLHGPEGLATFLEELQVPYRWLAPRGWSPEVVELQGGGVAGEGWRVTSSLVEHGSAPALAFRIEAEGRTLCYSGDSGWCDGLLEAARGADLFLCECALASGEPPRAGHLGGEEVGRLAARAGVGRLLLTHLPEAADLAALEAQVAAWYPGPVEAARDGAVYTL